MVKKKQNKVLKKLDDFSKNKIVAIFIIAILLVLFTWFVFMTTTGLTQKMANTKVLLETTEGNITIELYSEKMPITAGNFESLVKKEFYDGIIFHRVIKDFMIQGGDPTGTGMGGSGAVIEDEFVKGPTNIRGTLSMANSGPNSGSSQFFINLVDNTFLDWDNMQAPNSKHPVFGEVIEGMDIVDKIGSIETGAQDRPVKEVKILKATII